MTGPACKFSVSKINRNVPEISHFVVVLHRSRIQLDEIANNTCMHLGGGGVSMQSDDFRS